MNKAIGIDLGGTYIKYGLVDNKGSIIKRVCFQQTLNLENVIL